jgi:fructosamine-3-kinase
LSGRTFVKRRADAPPGFFATEAAGLDWLREGPLRVPEVIAVSEDSITLEFIAGGAGRLDARLGRGLARLHALGAERWGAARCFIGPLEFPNGAADSWAEFYGAQRLEPVLRMAADAGALPYGGAGRVERVIGRLDELCGSPEEPARLHGDLWSGNVMAGPCLIDPGAYGGHREVDLAMLSLFGSPEPDFLPAYEEIAPLADGHTERVALYQLLPLLVHAALFGGHYGASADRAVRAYL